MGTAFFQEIVGIAEAPSIGGQHSEIPFRLAAVPANTRQNFSVSPPVNFDAMLIHHYTFGGTVPETFQIWVQQRMASYHTVILSEIEIRDGVTVLQAVTRANQTRVDVMNLDAINPHPFRAVIWTVNIPKMAGLDLLLMAIKKRFGVESIVER